MGINQPYYLPYIGFFERIKACDYFAINSFTPLKRIRASHRRVKIIQQHPEANQDFLYLTQCLSPSTEGQFYNEIHLDKKFWERQENHIKTIWYTYKRAPFFNYLEDLLTLMENQESKNLGEYNTRLIIFLAKKLGLEKKIIDITTDEGFSKVNFKKEPKGFKNRATYITFIICKKLKASLHLAGQNGPLWLDETPFITHKIEVLYQRIKFVPYRQFVGKPLFIPGLSVIDLIFNYGPRAREWLGANSDFVKRWMLLKTTKLTGR